MAKPTRAGGRGARRMKNQVACPRNKSRTWSCSLKANPRGGSAKPFECPHSASTPTWWPSRLLDWCPELGVEPVVVDGPRRRS